LPSAIRLAEDSAPDDCLTCAEKRSEEALIGPSAILCAIDIDIDTAQTRISMVL
jgi:hypothetical protein